MTKLADWERNVRAIALCQFLILVGVGAGAVLIPYQVQHLGLVGEKQVAHWLGFAGAASSIGFAIASPLWGLFGDRFGRKLSLVRAVGAMTIIALCRSLAVSPTQLMVLGILQAAYFAGASIGPLLGGYVGDSLGFRSVFVMATIIIAIAMILIIALVREPAPERRTSPAQSQEHSDKTDWLLGRRLWPVIAICLALNLGLTLANPIVPLYIQRMAQSKQWSAASLAGTITGLSSLAAAVAALLIGHLGQKAGAWRVLILSVVGMAMFYVPLALVRAPMTLAVLLSLQGFFRGGIGPNLNTIVVGSAPQTHSGAALGIATSAGQIGLALGPLIGSILAATFTLRGTFGVAAGTVGLTTIGLIIVALRSQVGKRQTDQIYS